jgi:hypothetical protein
MAHFAKLNENNIVLDIIVVSNETLNNTEFPESEALGVAFLTEWSGGHAQWKQTSFNSNFRKRYAAIDGSWNPQLSIFIHPSPHASWVLDENTEWQPPTPKPNDGKKYRWNEDTVSWEEIVYVQPVATGAQTL